MIFCIFCNDSFLYVSIIVQQITDYKMASGLAYSAILSPFVWKHTHIHMFTADCRAVQQAPGSWGDKCVFLHVCVFVEYFLRLLSHTQQLLLPRLMAGRSDQRVRGGGLMGRQPCPGQSQTCLINLITLPHAQIAADFFFFFFSGFQ